MPSETSSELLKLSVENGMARVAVQPVLVMRAFGDPHSIPIWVLHAALICQRRIELRTKRIDGEHIRVTAVVIRRHQNGEVIVDGEVGVAAEFRGNDSFLRGVKAFDAEVQSGRVVEDLDPCLLGGLSAFKGLTLVKVGHDRC